MKWKPNALSGKAIGINILAVVLLVLGVVSAGGTVYTLNARKQQQQPRYTVVIDPGHGGNDPGKIGVNQVKEKDLNLIISTMLRQILEQNGCKVIMTRESDAGLYQTSDTNKKTADLRKRCEIVDQQEVDVAVSIHQNSFSQESTHGAQVFYQSTSQSGKQLAEILQQVLIHDVDPENHRTAKGNNDYYMLKNTQKTMVIVECGFLSNGTEAQKLCQESYQRRIAWAIATGTLQYLEGAGQEN